MSTLEASLQLVVLVEEGVAIEGSEVDIAGVRLAGVLGLDVVQGAAAAVGTSVVFVHCGRSHSWTRQQSRSTRGGDER